MARRFLTAIDLAKNELQNAVVQNLGAAPSSPAAGQLYYDSAGQVLYWWDGSTWRSAAGAALASSVTAETAVGVASNPGAGTTASRGDHTHGTPTHDAAAHSTIPVSALAAATANVNLNNFSIINLGPPSSGTDAANKNYVDGLVNGLSWKDPVRIASTANLGLSGLAAIDGVTPLGGDRVLVKNQTTANANGIYVASSGAWTRATDADAGPELEGAAVFVMEGSTQGDTAWVMTTNAPIVLGS